MVREITILIGDEECTAGLLTEQAPGTCEAIENALPPTGLLNHAKLVDREVFFTGKLEGFQYVSNLSGR